MLTITIPGVEQFNEETNEFINFKEQTLQLEHSLVSLSRWESKWNKPFISKNPKTVEEDYDYVRCMTLTKNVKPETYRFIPSAVMQQINEYITAPMSATTITERPGAKTNQEQLTAELLYYYMIALNIPFECEKWHLNRLIMLIRVCNIKNSPPTKMGKRELMNRNRSLNAARRQQFNSKG